MTTNDLRQVLDGAMLHGVGNDSWGRIVLDVSVNRQDHVAAINDLFVASQRLGYTLSNGEVRSIVDSAVYGGLGTGALGLTSKNALTAGSAALVGGIVGRELKRVEVIYEVHPNVSGGWTFSPPPAPTLPQSGLAAA